MMLLIIEELLFLVPWEIFVMLFLIIDYIFGQNHIVCMWGFRGV